VAGSTPRLWTVGSYASPLRQILPRATGDGYNEPMSGSDHVKPATSGVKLTYDDLEPSLARIFRE